MYFVLFQVELWFILIVHILHTYRSVSCLNVVFLSRMAQLREWQYKSHKLYPMQRVTQAQYRRVMSVSHELRFGIYHSEATMSAGRFGKFLLTLSCYSEKEAASTTIVTISRKKQV